MTGAGRVLVVEDDPGYARLVELQLGDALDPPAGVDVARTIADACLRLTQGGIGCVVLDLSLPDGEGPELLDLLRLVAPGVPVIVQSGNAAPGLAAEVASRGAAGFLAKDHEPAALLEAVTRALAAGPAG